MSLCVIEINDLAIRLTRDGKVAGTSPGFAVIEKSKVETGTDACNKAHLKPRLVNNRFWQQLNETPLHLPNRSCRHNADIAYHHLTQILRQFGSPKEAVVAVPGHYSNEQLALLLGIAQACNLKVVGLIDVAVAAAASSVSAGSFTVVDMHQHHVTLTDLTVATEVERKHVETIDQSGLNRLHDACVALIADAFLEQSRFDPLHEAQTEQLLHTHLPRWLLQAVDAPEVVIAVDYRGNRFNARIASHEFSRIVEMVLQPVRDRLRDGRTVLAMPILGQLPGAMAQLTLTALLPGDAVYEAVAEHRLAIGTSKDGVEFTTKLAATSAPSIEICSKLDAHVPLQIVTHVLSGHKAAAVTARPLFLCPDGSLQDHADSDSRCKIVSNGHAAILHSNGTPITINGHPVEDTAELEPGDRIALVEAGRIFVTITVTDRGT